MFRKQILVAVCVALGACSSAAEQQYTGFPAPGAGGATVSVENNYSSDMAVYVLKQGGRWRIGTVMGGMSESMQIPADLMTGSEIQLLADPIGPENGYLFPRMALASGSRVELRLERNLVFSSFLIR